jgi:thiol-disulfide isomerase/thioredoxin
MFPFHFNWCIELLKRRKMRNILLLFLFIIFQFFISYLSLDKNIENITLDQLDKKNETSFVVYFARDDCPDCQRMDAYLQKNQTKLTQKVYRIETKKEPNKEKLQVLLLQENIKEVPTFLQKNGEKFYKVSPKVEKNVVAFQRLNGD